MFAPVSHSLFLDFYSSCLAVFAFSLPLQHESRCNQFDQATGDTFLRFCQRPPGPSFQSEFIVESLSSPRMLYSERACDSFFVSPCRPCCSCVTPSGATVSGEATFSREATNFVVPCEAASSGEATVSGEATNFVVPSEAAPVPGEAPVSGEATNLVVPGETTVSGEATISGEATYRPCLLSCYL